LLTAFATVVAIVAANRIIELQLSRLRRRRLVARGAIPADERGFALMVALHVAVLLGGVFEAAICARDPPVWLICMALAGVIAANVLRWWVIATLDEHWNVRVLDSTALGVVDTGPYRFVRHPNYVAVWLELAALPLVAGAWITCVAGTIGHMFILARRIALEERILLASGRYVQLMAHKPRFVPRAMQLGRWTWPR